MMLPLQAIDLCCGAGGWAYAARGLPIRFVAAIDTAADCRETWRINHAANHPECLIVDMDLSDGRTVGELLGSLQQMNPNRYDHRPRVDLVLGGIPCEPVSTVRYCGGARARAKPEELEVWHRLIDNVLRIVRELRPRWWCVEDVIQIEKHLPTWLEHGQEIPLRRIQASHFGPQRRLRTFLGEFPRPEHKYLDGALRECLLPGPHMTIPNAERYERRGILGQNQAHLYNDGIRVLDPDAVCPTVWGGLDRGSRQRRAFMLQDDRGRLRKLDWRELALVQGFPDDALFAAGLIRTMKMVGQAIDIHVGRAILEAIVEEASRKAEAGMQEQDLTREAARRFAARPITVAGLDRPALPSYESGEDYGGDDDEIDGRVP